MATTYTISDLAREFDLTTRAMRFYEDMGLLQPSAPARAAATASTARATAPGSSSRCAPSAWGCR
jgi:hypothetical protein